MGKLGVQGDVPGMEGNRRLVSSISFTLRDVI